MAKHSKVKESFVLTQNEVAQHGNSVIMGFTFVDGDDKFVFYTTNSDALKQAKRGATSERLFRMLDGKGRVVKKPEISEFVCLSNQTIPTFSEIDDYKHSVVIASPKINPETNKPNESRDFCFMAASNKTMLSIGVGASVDNVSTVSENKTATTFIPSLIIDGEEQLPAGGKTLVQNNVTSKGFRSSSEEMGKADLSLARHSINTMILDTSTIDMIK